MGQTKKTKYGKEKKGITPGGRHYVAHLINDGSTVTRVSSSAIGTPTSKKFKRVDHVKYKKSGEKNTKYRATYQEGGPYDGEYKERAIKKSFTKKK